ncbi:hypothetical protein L1987_06298 [Smallanthus sonchifolius]|uniref:Uncharacterized protein n=1 Tax=Smallanthus sonchifolius TaxID=185202 RepID=A0ACB9JXV0_9ASTR|nr:hypothetical protein L1987_06298 [Smallanthus sonchifolius]
MLEENPDPDVGVNDEVDDILSSGVEDNEGDDDDGDEGGDDGDEGGDDGEGGVVQGNVNQESEQPVNNQVSETITENEVPVGNESGTVKDSDQDKNVGSSLNENELVKESENVQVDVPVATSNVEATSTTNNPVQRKEVEAEKNVPSRPPPSKVAAICHKAFDALL